MYIDQRMGGIIIFLTILEMTVFSLISPPYKPPSHFSLDVFSARWCPALLIVVSPSPWMTDGKKNEKRSNHSRLV